MPFAVAAVRMLGEAGHEVYAADTFHTSPGSHSAGVTEAFIVPPPVQEPNAFIGALADIIDEHDIDMLVPCFEEVFFIAHNKPLLATKTEVFCPDFETLAKLHNKATFTEWCQRNSLPIPETAVARSRAELDEATKRFDPFFARAAYSRGGVELFTNEGPLAGVVKLEDTEPTPGNPWVVQGFVKGTDLCSYSIVRDGKVQLHLTYEHPITIEHAGGIQFVSIDEPGTLDIAAKIAQLTNYTGQLSFDYMRHEDGSLTLVECNPRPTDGVALLDAETYSYALTGTGPFASTSGDTWVLEAGRSKEIKTAIMRDMIRDWHEIPRDARALVTGDDLYGERGDMRPALYQFLSYSHVLAFRHQMHTGKHKHSDIMEAQFYDISWDGSPIE